MSFREQGRQAAHVLIDAVSVADVEAPDATNLAYQRLAEVGAFTIAVEDDGDDLNVTVDLSDVLGGAYITIAWLVDQLSGARGQTRDQILIQLREFVDTEF